MKNPPKLKLFFAESCAPERLSKLESEVNAFVASLPEYLYTPPDTLFSNGQVLVAVRFTEGP